MKFPKYDELMEPILKCALKESITRRSMTDAMADAYHLSPQERSALLPSGSSTYIANRVGWAMTFLTKAKLIEKVEKSTYRASKTAKPFLEKNPNGFTHKNFQSIEGYNEAWQNKKKDKQKSEAINSSATPEDRIEDATKQVSEQLQSEIIEQLTQVNPYRFEQIVIDKQSAMGYGGSREEAAKVTQQSNDEGIDGIINEDRLGLDVIYVQAKRWQGNIGRKEIQSFVGALAGKQANKGVFITTSEFVDTAKKYAQSVSQKVILIDGDRLSELMIEHGVGVSTVRSIAIKRIDSDYFEDWGINPFEKMSARNSYFTYKWKKKLTSPSTHCTLVLNDVL